MKSNRIKESFEKVLNEAGYTKFRNQNGEIDDFYDPYKKEPEYKYEGDFSKVDWDSRICKGLDFSSVEGLSRAAEVYELYFTGDFVHDLAHDGDVNGARDLSQAISRLQSKIIESAEQLGIKSEDLRDCESKDILKRFENFKNRKPRVRKPVDIESLKNEIRNLINGEYSEFKEFFTEDGDLKDRKSWGWIKLGATPVHKLAKKLWIAEYGK
jgi:hypothetical protein